MRPGPVGPHHGRGALSLTVPPMTPGEAAVGYGEPSAEGGTSQGESGSSGTGDDPAG